MSYMVAYKSRDILRVRAMATGQFGRSPTLNSTSVIICVVLCLGRLRDHDLSRYRDRPCYNHIQ